MEYSAEKYANRDIEVLIVEDEIDICFLLTGILRKNNLQSSFVHTIYAAQHLLTTTRPSILFLDNNLPDGYGVDFIQKVKITHPLISIVMLTADDTIANKNKALKSGADFFMGKPFTRDAINKIINSVLEKVH